MFSVGRIAMKGKTHATIGLFAGIAITAVGIRQGDFSYALALVSASTAALLPDIDHDNARAGKIRRQISKLFAFILGASAIVGMLYIRKYLANSYFFGWDDNFRNCLIMYINLSAKSNQGSEEIHKIYTNT